MLSLSNLVADREAMAAEFLAQLKAQGRTLTTILKTNRCTGQIDALALARSYMHRWPAQEKVIKDWLLPLGLDINYGFAKTPVVNSEVSKKREAFEKRYANVDRWRETAREKAHRASQLFHLPGRIRWSHDAVHIDLRPFNNRQLTRDLLAMCQRVNEIQPRLPDGRLLILHAPSSPSG